MIEKDDIVQVTNPDNKWYPCLVIVDEVKTWGIQGYTTIPLKGDAYIRVTTEDFEKVGKAVVVAS